MVHPPLYTRLQWYLSDIPARRLLEAIQQLLRSHRAGCGRLQEKIRGQNRLFPWDSPEYPLQLGGGEPHPAFFSTKAQAELLDQPHVGRRSGARIDGRHQFCQAVQQLFFPSLAEDTRLHLR